MDGAVRLYERAIQLVPDQLPALDAGAHVLVLRGRHAEALGFVQRIRRLAPEEARFAVAEAQLHLELDDAAGAARSLAESVPAWKSDAAAALTAAEILVLRCRAFEVAGEILPGVADAHPAQFQLRYLAALALHSEGRSEEARSALETASALGGDRAHIGRFLQETRPPRGE